MSDLMEKLLTEEQDTDAKFVAAADFFMKLKEKEAAATPKARGVKAKKIRTQAAADIKDAVSSGGGQSVAMKKPVKVKAIAGQAKATDGRGMGGFKKFPQKPLPKNQLAKVNIKEPKKKVKVVIASALAERLVKEAFVLNWLKGTRGVVGQGTKAVKETVGAGTKKAVESGKDFKAGFESTPGTVLGNTWKNIKNSFGSGPRMETISNVPTTGFGRKVQSVKNIMRNPALIEREKQVAERLAAWQAKNVKPVGDAATPEAIKAWTAKYNNMVKGQRGKLNTYKAGMDARNVTGLPETTSSVLSKIRNPDGTYTMDSVLKGAENMGLFNPETLMTMGMSGKATMDAARAAKAAAQKDKMLKWGIGGAAGLGGLALLKRPKNDART